MTSRIHIEPGNDSRREDGGAVWCTLWGYVFEDDRPAAVYYVRWNDTSLEEAEFVISVGEWGEESEPTARRCVANLGRKYQGRLAFMLGDADASSFSDQTFLGSMCSAAEVRGTPLAKDVFRILDEILVQDERVAMLRIRLEA